MSEEKTELQLLQSRARLMGLKFHPQTGVEKMRILVNGALPEKEKEEGLDIVPGVAKIPYETRKQRESRQRKTAGMLVRIRVTNMNQNTKDKIGEIFTVGNSFCTFKKYVPFNAPDGWHVPFMIYQHLVERKCQVFHTATNSKGHKTRKGKLINEFAIEILPPLTQEEHKDLAQRQALTQANG